MRNFLRSPKNYSYENWIEKFLKNPEAWWISVDISLKKFTEMADTGTGEFHDNFLRDLYTKISGNKKLLHVKRLLGKTGESSTRRLFWLIPWKMLRNAF